MIKTLTNISAQLIEKNEFLDKELENLSSRVSRLEQMSISNYVEIKGIPEIKGENCKRIVEKIAAIVGQEVRVTKAYRLTLKFGNYPSKIIGELTSLDQKNKMIESSKNMKIKASSVNANWGETNIFVNNYLNKYYSDLLYETRMFAKEKGYKSVWYQNYKIHIRKKNGAKIYVINDFSDLSNIQKRLST